MRLDFSEQDKNQEINKIYLEEDDLLMEGEYLTGEGKDYIITGVATIEGERYHEFQIEFGLVNEPESMTIQGILEQEWEWYDYIC